MSKRVIYILGGTMAISVILLIIIQMLSVQRNIEIKREHLNTLVNNSLSNVIRRIEIAELEEATSRLSKGGSLSSSIGSSNSYLGKSDSKIYHKRTNPGGLPTAFESQGVSDESKELWNVFKKLTDNRGSSGEYSYNQGLANKKDIQERSIRDRLDFKHLRSMISGELRNNGLDNTFRVAISQESDGVITYMYRDEGYKESKSSVIKRPLFPNDLNPRPEMVSIYFEDELRLVVEFGSLLILPAFILTLIIIVIFVVTLRIILKQKKLSIIKNDFINNMTHELKTPISTISLASQMLKDASMEHSPAVVSNISAVIFDESKRLSHQVEKVLQMAVFNEGRLKLKMVELDLNEIVKKVRNTFELQVTNEDGEFIVDLDSRPATVVADQVHITNVIFNLLDNAVKYSLDNPKINLSTEVVDKYVIITVKDSGIGIAREHVDQIFERFYRVPTGNVHDVKGFGLGLSYVKKIVDNHKGHIKVDSSQGKGTRFRVFLPLK